MLIDANEGCIKWENAGCLQIRAVGPPPLLYTNTMFIASLDWNAELSPTDLRNDAGLSWNAELSPTALRNDAGLSVQSVSPAWYLQHKKNKGKSRRCSRERHDAQHHTMRKRTQNCLRLHTFAK